MKFLLSQYLHYLIHVIMPAFYLFIYFYVSRHAGLLKAEKMSKYF